MTILKSGLSIKPGSDPTYVEPTGGTPVTLNVLGGDLEKTMLYISGASLLESYTFDFSTRPHKVAAGTPNGYTQSRASLHFKRPRTLANDNTTIDSVRVDLSHDVEATTANIREMMLLVSQITGHLDYSGFWANKSLE